MKFFRQLFICLSLFFSLVSEAGHDDRLKIVFFGDSITALWPTVDSVFAQRVPELLANQGINCEPIIAGVGGSHSGTLADNDFAKVAHARDRFETDVLNRHPDVVVIGFGTNDAYIDGDDPNGQSRIALEKFEANLKFMITALQDRGILVILRTPCPFAFPEERMYQDRRLYDYVKMVRGLSEQYNTGLSDNYKLFKDYASKHNAYANLFPDGVHPNDEGHALIAKSVAEEILRHININTID
ncbi:lipase [Parapedobacter pyrenivorans]|uniref:Lipase n=1 Tax=Parapedobacter pyrenivorans TaxID=1305674 RepID=A0A917HBC4_9SPHI|nr:SGNH/GDSL hydrolase family protein [Parapedobacter pyrenivorans]GGG73833.1 lipase [Parapedobacter pyrenivorans]